MDRISLPLAMIAMLAMIAAPGCSPLALVAAFQDVEPMPEPPPPPPPIVATATIDLGGKAFTRLATLDSAGRATIERHLRASTRWNVQRERPHGEPPRTVALRLEPVRRPTDGARKSDAPPFELTSDGIIYFPLTGYLSDATAN